MTKLPKFYSHETISLTQIAGKFGGEVIRNGEFENLGMFRNAGVNLLTLLYDKKYLEQFEENKGRFSCVITTKELVDFIPEDKGIILFEEPITLFFLLHEWFCDNNFWFYQKRFKSIILSKSGIHKTVVIPEFNVFIDEDVTIDANTVIKENCHISKGCYIGPNISISTEGFEVRRINGKLNHIKHGGGVYLDENVLVFANSVIAKSLFSSPTYIGKSTVIDDLVHIAHAASIGEECRIVSGASIGGATRLGKGVWVGPNAVIANSLVIGDNSWIAMGSSVAKDVAPNTRISSLFARVMP